MVNEPTFEQLPKVVMTLAVEVNELKRLILKERKEKRDNPPKLQEKFLSTEEAAKFLNIAVTSLYVKVHKREIPFMKRGKRLYFSGKELAKYIKGGKSLTVDEIDSIAEKHLSK